MFYISGTLKIHLNFFGYPMEIIYLQRLIKSHLMRVIAIFEITKEDVLKNLLNFWVDPSGFEPETSSVQGKHSTTELQAQWINMTCSKS